MFERESTLFAFMNGYLRNVLRDISDEDFHRPLPGVTNSAAWTAAHLAICNDQALALMGREPVCPAAWREAFGRGKTPGATEAPTPSREEILDALRRGEEQVLAAARAADAVEMSQPQAIPAFQGTPFQTVGDLVALLMTTHIALHVGQLSLMRRQLGHGPLF